MDLYGNYGLVMYVCETQAHTFTPSITCLSHRADVDRNADKLGNMSVMCDLKKMLRKSIWCQITISTAS